MRSQVAVGVDLAQQKFDATRLQDGKYRHKCFANTPAGFAVFVVWLAGFEGDPPHLCLEATGAYSTPLAEFLADQGFWVSVVNPAKIQAFAKSALSRVKTDKADAKRIARYAHQNLPPRWNPPPPAIRELQALQRRVEPLWEMRQMERNRLDTADPTIVPSIHTLLNAVKQALEATRATIRRRSRSPAAPEPVGLHPRPWRGHHRSPAGAV